MASLVIVLECVQLFTMTARYMAVSLAFDDRKLSMTALVQFPVETARFFRPIAADAGL